jgi:mannitol-1-phosphate 5-dehydrogenase
LLFFQNKKDVTLSSGKGKNIKIPIKGTVSSLDIEKISSLALNIDCIFVAVRLSNINQLIDTILLIVLRRYAYDIQEAINFVFDENFQVYDKTLEALQYEIYRKIDNPDIKSYFDEFVGLVPSINEAIISEIKIDSRNPIKVEEYIPPLYVDETKWKKRKGCNTPSLSDKITFENNFVAIHMRKLWVHNMAHSLTGYLGHALGYKTIPEAISDGRINQKVRSAMKSIGNALYSRWDYSDTEHKDIESYIEWCIKKYKNKFMADTIDRICRDPERKLRENDRLIGPLNYIWQYDKTVAKDILIGIIAAAKYNPKKYKQMMVDVTRLIKIDPKELSMAAEDYDQFVMDK